MRNNLGMDPRETKASGELRMCVSVVAATLSAYSASHMQEQRESEFKLNASITFVFWTPTESSVQQNLTAAIVHMRK